MFNLFNLLKKKKKYDDFLPSNLKLNSYLNFNDLMFSNLGYDSKFILDSNENIVKEIGIIEESNRKIVNLYLDNKDEEEQILKLIYENNRLIKSIFYKNYDIIDPQSDDEWEMWLGSSDEIGLLGDFELKLEDESIERIQDILYKLSKKLDKNFNSHSLIELELKENILFTNYFEILSKKISREKILKAIKEDSYLNKIILEITDEKIILDIEKLNENLEFIYLRESEKSLELQEKIYNREELILERNIVFCEYKRKIENEFFQEEYLKISAVEEDNRVYISLDVGIEISLNQLKSM